MDSFAADSSETDRSQVNTTISFGVPCYNSAAYMDACISSILKGCEFAPDVQVIIVDDGSQGDETPDLADEWARRYPQHVKVIHQENGGHGCAVLAAIAAADGAYFKIIDSDDWVGAGALRALLYQLRRMLEREQAVDLIITNYVYEHAADNTSKTIDFRNVLPRGKVIGWDRMGFFGPGQYLMMHALTYRTALLRAGSIPMPAHTFYVDNIYAYIPLPRVSTIYYLDVDLYHYYIGRPDQSVNEQVVIQHIDQQLRVSRIMLRAYHLYDEVESVKLRNYMLNYLSLMMATTSVYVRLSNDAADRAACDALWQEFKEFDSKMYHTVRNSVFGAATNLPTKVGDCLTLWLYRQARKIFKFN